MTGLAPLFPNRRKKTTISLLAIIIGAVVFVTMWYSVANHALFAQFDQPVLDFMVAHRSPTATAIMRIITDVLAPVTFALLVTAGCVAWGVYRREAWRPLLLMGAMAAAMVISTVIKDLVTRSRPPHTLMLAPYEVDYSFPSGHTIGIATFVLVVSYLLYSRRFSLSRRLLWAIAGILAIVIVAISRLYLGYHWITDVSASAGLAAVILGLVIVIDTYAPEGLKAWIEEKAKGRTPRSVSPAK